MRLWLLWTAKRSTIETTRLGCGRSFPAIQVALIEEIRKSKRLPASTRVHVMNVLNRVKKAAGV